MMMMMMMMMMVKPREQTGVKTLPFCTKTFFILIPVVEERASVGNLMSIHLQKHRNGDIWWRFSHFIQHFSGRISS